MKNNASVSKVHLAVGGESPISSSGVSLLAETAEVGGLTNELSASLTSWRKPLAVHDPDKVVLDLALAIAAGGGDCLVCRAVACPVRGLRAGGCLMPSSTPAGPPAWLLSRPCSSKYPASWRFSPSTTSHSHKTDESMLSLPKRSPSYRHICSVERHRQRSRNVAKASYEFPRDLAA